MTRRLMVLLAVFLGLVPVCFMVLRSAQPPRSTSTDAGAASESCPLDHDDVPVSIEIPPLSEFPGPWAETDGCPHTRLTGALRASVGPSNGCPVLSVESGGPADKAGIRPGDRLGGPDDCASSLYQSFAPGIYSRTIEWTVHRPRSAG